MRWFVVVASGLVNVVFFFFSSRRRHTRCSRDWSSDVCSSDLITGCSSKNSAGSKPPDTLRPTGAPTTFAYLRSEEHTSELQSRLHLVCRLLLEKKKKHAVTCAHLHHIVARKPALSF